MTRVHVKTVWRAGVHRCGEPVAIRERVWTRTNKLVERQWWTPDHRKRLNQCPGCGRVLVPTTVVEPDATPPPQCDECGGIGCGFCGGR